SKPRGGQSHDDDDGRRPRGRRVCPPGGGRRAPGARLFSGTDSFHRRLLSDAAAPWPRRPRRPPPAGTFVPASAAAPPFGPLTRPAPDLPAKFVRPVRPRPSHPHAGRRPLIA